MDGFALLAYSVQRIFYGAAAMKKHNTFDFSTRIVAPEKVLEKIKPGMSIFIGTGVSEPRSILRALMESDSENLCDLELIQLVSLGDAVAIEDRYSEKFRLKTFYTGWVTNEAVSKGRIDIIPTRFSKIPSLISSGIFKIDAAFIQITPPNSFGYVSLGPSVDVARQVMEKASLIVGEINPLIPRTSGDTFVNIDCFHYLTWSELPLYTFQRWPVDEVYEKIAANAAMLIDDGSCMSFSVGPVFEALSRKLIDKKHIGVHTAIITDSVMDLVKAGVITNSYKRHFKGKTVCSYAVGSEDLMEWLDENPLVEFHPIDIVANSRLIGENNKFRMILPAKKVSLAGAMSMHEGTRKIIAGPGEAQDFLTGTAFSEGGRLIYALPSRNRKNESNILISLDGLSYKLINPEAPSVIVTEYGIAPLEGRTIRERALSIIDVAHPDDRDELIEKAKDANILFRWQTYCSKSVKQYPQNLDVVHNFSDDLVVYFRPIKPHDVDEMRRLFYRFSDQAVYYRYFSPIKTMTYEQMQDYVTIDYCRAMSLVAFVYEPLEGHLIAEARYMCQDDNSADVAFIVDEKYHNKGIASKMLTMLINIASERGVKKFSADVLHSNIAMRKVFSREAYKAKVTLNANIYNFEISLAPDSNK